MPERDHTEERGLARDMENGAAGHAPNSIHSLLHDGAAAIDRLISEADTAEREATAYKSEAERWEQQFAWEVLNKQAAERDLGEARKALEWIGRVAERRRNEIDWRGVYDCARAALASLTDTDSEGDPVLDALARGDESMAARLTTEREQMLRGRVVLTVEEAEQIAGALVVAMGTDDAPLYVNALALLREREHTAGRLDAANQQ